MKDISIENILNEIIKRILSVVRPKKIILFGSAVREEMHANSDIDLLVVILPGSGTKGSDVMTVAEGRLNALFLLLRKFADFLTYPLSLVLAQNAFSKVRGKLCRLVRRNTLNP